MAARTKHILAVSFALAASARLAESAQHHAHTELKAGPGLKRRSRLLTDVRRAIFQRAHLESRGHSVSNGSWFEGENHSREESQNTTEWGQFLLRMSGWAMHNDEPAESTLVQLEPPICMEGRAVPQLYLLGAQKAGTTTMAADFLNAGIRSAVGAIKELHAFDRICDFRTDASRNESEWTGRVSAGVCRHKRAHYEEWLQNFDRACEDVTASLIDMTPLNMRLPHLPVVMNQWYGADSSRLGFIIALREPLSRLHSGYYHACSFGMNRYYALFEEYVDMVLERAPALLNLTDTTFARDYPLDEFYRSMYSRTVNPWLRTFQPGQFLLVPMGAYFRSLEYRRTVITTMKEKFGVVAFEDNLLGTTQMNHRAHTSLADDLSERKASLVQEIFFSPDIERFAGAVARRIPQGLVLAGYQDDVIHVPIRSYLEANW